MSSAKPKLSFPESLVVWDSAAKATSYSRWLDSELEALEQNFEAYITVQSSRRAAQATMASINETR